MSAYMPQLNFLNADSQAITLQMVDRIFSRDTDLLSGETPKKANISNQAPGLKGPVRPPHGSGSKRLRTASDSRERLNKYLAKGKLEFVSFFYNKLVVCCTSIPRYHSAVVENSHYKE